MTDNLVRSTDTAKAESESMAIGRPHSSILVAIVAVFAIVLSNADRLSHWMVEPQGPPLESQLQATITKIHDELKRLSPEAEVLIKEVAAVRDWSSPLTGQQRVQATQVIIAGLQETYGDYIPNDSKQKLDDANGVLERAKLFGSMVTVDVFKQQFEANYEGLVDDEIHQWTNVVAEAQTAAEKASEYLAGRTSFEEFEKTLSQAAGPLTRRRADASNPPRLYKLVCQELYVTAWELNQRRTRHPR